jgi:hypothetical protein
MLNTGPHGLSEVLYAFTSRQQQRLGVRRHHRNTPGTTPRSGWRCCSAGSCRWSSCWPGRLAGPAEAGAGVRGHAAHPPAAVRRTMLVGVGRDRRRPDLPSPRSRSAPSPSVFAWLITVWLWLTVLFANLAEAVAEGRGKAQAETLRAQAKKETVARRLARTAARRGARHRAAARRPRRRRGRRGHPRRRRRRRGHRLGRRVGDHRRVRAGDPRVRRRPLRGHRRHQGAVRPDRREDHRQAGRDASSTG